MISLMHEGSFWRSPGSYDPPQCLASLGRWQSSPMFGVRRSQASQSTDTHHVEQHNASVSRTPALSSRVTKARRRLAMTRVRDGDGNPHITAARGHAENLRSHDFINLHGLANTKSASLAIRSCELGHMKYRSEQSGCGQILRTSKAG